MQAWLERRFRLPVQNTTVRTELLAGVTPFRGAFVLGR